MSNTQTVTWIPVSNELPEKLEESAEWAREVNVATAGGAVSVAHFVDGEWIYTNGTRWNPEPRFAVTHWAEPLKHPSECEPDPRDAEIAQLKEESERRMNGWTLAEQDRKASVDEVHQQLAAAESALTELREKLNWQNMPNRNPAARGGYEFYINEEWSCIRDAAMDTDPGFHASLLKTRFDPDDERVRVRKILDDDALLEDLSKVESDLAAEQALSEQRRETLEIAGCVIHRHIRHPEGGVRIAESSALGRVERALALAPTDALRKRLLEVAEKACRETHKMSHECPGLGWIGVWERLKPALEGEL